MSSGVTLLPMNEVQVGMTLSNNLLDIHGNLILGQGAIVTEAILLSLQRRGIQTLGVVPQAGEDIDRKADRERQRQRLAKLFRLCGDNPVGKLLLQYVTQYRLGDSHE